MASREPPTTTDPASNGPAPRPRGRLWLVLAAVFVGLFVVNVGLRMLFIKQHIEIWRLDDVGEFLLVLIAMAFFVLGILRAERSP
jgi:hypothetical protein